MSIRVNSYFSGAGLFDLGLQRGGLEIRQSLEIDEVCCATHRRNFKHRVVKTDVKQELVGKQPAAEVYAATYPCTKYSTIADIHEARTGDELYLHFFRMLAIARPEAYTLENVPGMKKFTVVMEAMTKLPDYYVSVFCPVSAHLWLPQERDRLIIMATRRPFNWRPPVARRFVPLAEILEHDPQVIIPPSVYSRLHGKYRDQPIISDPARGDLAPTCVAHYAKDRSTRLVVDKRFKHGVRPYTVREYARLQGVPDSFEFQGTEAQQYRQIGNGVPVPIGEWVGREFCRYFGRKAA